MVTITVHVSLPQFERLQEALEKDLSSNAASPIRKAFRDWAKIFERFIRDRFEKFSKGGGDWKPLSPVTIRKKNRSKPPGSPFILQNSDLLFTGISAAIGNPAVAKDIPNGISVNLNPALTLAYPKTAFTTTIGDVAGYHHTGGGRLPKREIIAPPDQETVNKLKERLEEGIHELLAS